MGTLRLIKGAAGVPVTPPPRSISACSMWQAHWFVFVVAREQVLQHHLEKNRKGKSSHSEQSEGDERSWYLYINEEDLPEGEHVDCEMKMGSVVFFGNTIPHCSGDNTYYYHYYHYL